MYIILIYIMFKVLFCNFTKSKKKKALARLSAGNTNETNFLKSVILNYLARFLWKFSFSSNIEFGSGFISVELSHCSSGYETLL